MTETSVSTPARGRVLQHVRIAVVLLGALLALNACSGMGRDEDGLFYLTLTTAELQRDLESGFPVRKCSLKIACAQFSNPRLAMPEGADRVFFDSALNVEVMSLRYAGRVTLSGLPRYDMSNGTIHLSGLKVEQLAVEGVAPQVAHQIQKQGGNLLQPMFDSHPIYRIDANTLRGALLRRTLRSVKVVDGQLRASFSLLDAPTSP